MSHDGDVCSLRLLHRSRDLVESELSAVNTIAWRCHAAGNHQLDLRGALADLIAACLAHLRHSVAHDAKPVHAHAGLCILPGPSLVSMAARLGQCMTAEKDLWALDQVLLDCLGQPKVGAAGVTHGREPPQQHAAQDVPGPHCRVRRRLPGQHGEVRAPGRDVDVHVDQARHEGHAAGLDDPIARFRLDARANGSNRVAQDPDGLAGFGEDSPLHVEDPRVDKSDGLALAAQHGRLTRGLIELSLGHGPGHGVPAGRGSGG
mmetsp:Transcript_92302/g.288849  ORF Transcript_92302/g.288849 Transcript_92302/m.288849 type:complete len:261 (+) Transcript_92302:579-1361(+)